MKANSIERESPARQLEIEASINEVQDGDGPELVRARQALTDTAASMRKVLDRENAIMNDPNLTPDGRTLKMAQEAKRVFDSSAATLDTAAESLVTEAESLAATLQSGIQLDANQEPLRPLVLAHVAGLNDEQRDKLLARAREEGDTFTLKVLATSPDYLTGLSKARQNRLAGELFPAEDRERLERMVKMATALNNAQAPLKKFRAAYWTDEVERLVEAAKLAAA